MDLVYGSYEAVAHIWVTFNFEMDTDSTLTANAAEPENPLIQRPPGRAIDVSIALDWESEEYQLLQVR